MKRVLFICISFLAFCACRKDGSPRDAASGNYLSYVMDQLTDSLSPGDRASLDDHAVYKSDLGGGVSLLRIPIKGKAITGDFLLVSTDRTGRVLTGSLVHLERAGPAAPAPFAGSVRLSTLGGRTFLESAINNGYIAAFHPGQSATVKDLSVGETSLLDPYKPLPECIVVGYPNNNGYIDVSGYFIDLAQMLPPRTSGVPGGGAPGGNGGNGGIGGGLGGGIGSGNSGAAGGVGNTGGFIPLSVPDTGGAVPIMVSIPPTGIEPDYSGGIPPVNVPRVFNCFDQVPSAGATYSVTICTDVPVNSDPLVIVNSGGSTFGHSFLVATKSNGTVSVTQSFGFYPAQNPSVWSPTDPVPSAVKDNGGQEVNGSLTMTVSADQFANFKATAIVNSTNAYLLTDYNCTDFALQCFNSMRSTPLTLVPITITLPATPSTPAPPITINNSPQMLYALMAAMKLNNAPEAGNISLDLTGNTKAPASHGECP
jgi:hypothetical protein